jgi:SWIM zinc finger
MNSSIIGKIEKAQRYEHEPERVDIHNLEVDFKGAHSVYQVSLKGNHWSCSCSFYSLYGTCSHVMALQRILSPMLSVESRSESPLEHSAISEN